jgi:serine/threonine-protein kinase
MVFEAPTPTAYALAHVQTPPHPMSERSELPVPAGLEAIVMQLLEKDPADRIQSAQELARRLRALPGFDRWSPERAEQWWETNLPELTMQAPGADELETEFTAEPAHA